MNPASSDEVTTIDSLDRLRSLYPFPKERAVLKQLVQLDRHCKRFIKLSPFVVVSSAAANGRLDASPRGGPPGFVKVISDTALWIPDSPGNNRLDSIVNIIETGRVGLLFLIPGVDETLRVNGSAWVTADPQKTSQFGSDARSPKTIIEVSVEEAYLHCAKALMRSKLWSGEFRQDREALPSMGKMINDQTGINGPVESQEAMVERYTRDL